MAEKARHFDEVSAWLIAGFILRRRRNSFDENPLITAPHSPYNPDLAPSEFWFFGDITTSFASGALNDIVELLEAGIESLNEIQAFELQFVFRHWIGPVK
jgi:hypothetical protein